VSLATRGTAVAAAAVVAATLLAAPGEAKLIDGYCSPTGDYCTSAVDRSGKTFLGITTFSFTGKYRLCTRLEDGGDPNCKRFRLKKSGDTFRSFVKFSKHFASHGSDRYCASWHKFGARLGPEVCFAFTGD
jgi:hypothetical protein